MDPELGFWQPASLTCGPNLMPTTSFITSCCMQYANNWDITLNCALNFDTLSHTFLARKCIVTTFLNVVATFFVFGALEKQDDAIH